MLEFPADDTAGGDHEDALCEMSFHVPKESDRFGGEETVSAAEVIVAPTNTYTSAVLVLELEKQQRMAGVGKHIKQL